MGAQGFLVSACIVLLFVGAAVANVPILRSAIRGRSGHDHSSSVVPEPDS